MANRNKRGREETNGDRDPKKQKKDEDELQRWICGNADGSESVSEEEDARRTTAVEKYMYESNPDLLKWMMALEFPDHVPSASLRSLHESKDQKKPARGQKRAQEQLIYRAYSQELQCQSMVSCIQRGEGWGKSLANMFQMSTVNLKERLVWFEPIHRKVADATLLYFTAARNYFLDDSIEAISPFPMTPRLLSKEMFRQMAARYTRTNNAVGMKRLRMLVRSLTQERQKIIERFDTVFAQITASQNRIKTSGYFPKEFLKHMCSQSWRMVAFAYDERRRYGKKTMSLEEHAEPLNIKELEYAYLNTVRKFRAKRDVACLDYALPSKTSGHQLLDSLLLSAQVFEQHLMVDAEARHEKQQKARMETEKERQKRLLEGRTRMAELSFLVELNMLIPPEKWSDCPTEKSKFNTKFRVAYHFSNDSNPYMDVSDARNQEQQRRNRIAVIRANFGRCVWTHRWYISDTRYALRWCDSLSRGQYLPIVRTDFHLIFDRVADTIQRCKLRKDPSTPELWPYVWFMAGEMPPMTEQAEKALTDAKWIPGETKLQNDKTNAASLWKMCLKRTGNTEDAGGDIDLDIGISAMERVRPIEPQWMRLTNITVFVGLHNEKKSMAGHVVGASRSGRRAIVALYIPNDLERPSWTFKFGYFSYMAVWRPFVLESCPWFVLSSSPFNYHQNLHKFVASLDNIPDSYNSTAVQQYHSKWREQKRKPAWKMSTSQKIQWPGLDCRSLNLRLLTNWLVEETQLLDANDFKSDLDNKAAPITRVRFHVEKIWQDVAPGLVAPAFFWSAQWRQYPSGRVCPKPSMSVPVALVLSFLVNPLHVVENPEHANQ